MLSINCISTLSARSSITMAKIFTLKDVQNLDELNATFISINDLQGKPITIHKSELIKDERIKDKEKYSLRIIGSHQNSEEKFTTLSSSEILIKFHMLISEQGLYPMNVTIKTVNQKYIIE